jgi:hypothetical protein
MTIWVNPVDDSVAGDPLCQIDFNPTAYIPLTWDERHFHNPKASSGRYNCSHHIY